jgi:hypothetical protein
MIRYDMMTWYMMLYDIIYHMFYIKNCVLPILFVLPIIFKTKCFPKCHQLVSLCS